MAGNALILTLKRDYLNLGTNGEIRHGDVPVCWTIELPWKNNQQRVSCIPEGTYRVTKRWSEKFKSHLQLLDVPGRSLILLHPANDALKELNGCIAPVSRLTGEGLGVQSRDAFNRLYSKVVKAIEESKQVFLTIEQITHETTYS